jgi:hypothetical protein
MGGGIVVWLAAMATIDVALTWGERPPNPLLSKELDAAVGPLRFCGQR